MPKYVVGAIEDVPDRGVSVFNVGGRSIGVFRFGREVYAIRNRCPHQGGPLCRGPLVGGLTAQQPGTYDYVPDERYVQCPWHGWEFDLQTGQSWFDPAKTRVRPYPVSVASGEALAAEEPPVGRLPGPYQAETYPASVEHEYIVIELP
jgi:nitrite reductase/ring-hydroxylating ferredoxin subunit